MMKKTQRKLCIRYMRRQKAACLSIFVVAMLAVMAYLGIVYTAQAMKNNISRFWDETSFRDIEISASGLLAADDMETIMRTEGVLAAEPVWYTTAGATSQNAAAFDIISLSESINMVILEEGRMPNSAEECLLERPVLEELGLKIGDRFELTGTEYLSQRSFVVCGIAIHADHAVLPVHVPGNRYMMVKKEAFDLEGLGARCMRAVLKIKGCDGLSRFSDEYKEKSQQVLSRLNLLAAQKIGRQISGDEALSLEEILKKAMSGEATAEPWMVYDVWSSMYCYAIRITIDNVTDIGRTFALMFAVVGALVVFSSTHRMVEEDRHQIGMAKSLGLTGGETAMRYFAAGIIPAVAGMAAGAAAGFGALQMILLSIYGRFYVYGMGSPAFLPGITLTVFAIGLFIAAAAVFIACAGNLRKPALLLLNDAADSVKAPGHIKRSKKKARKHARSKYIYYLKMVIRQIRREKSRVMMTSVSIAGCMILLVTGFSIRSAISRSIEGQFEQIEKYDLKVRYDSNDAANEGSKKQAVLDILKSNGLTEGADQNGYIEAMEKECLYYAEGRVNGGRLLCTDPQKTDSFFMAKDIDRGKSFGSLDANGLYIPLRASETAGLYPGDSMYMLDESMRLKVVKVGGVYDNYVGGQMLLSFDSYEDIYREKCIPNSFLIKCEAGKQGDLTEKLASLSVTVTSTQEKEKEYLGYTTALNAVAAILAAIAALMAGGVLINLIYLQYYRRKNSLVVMRINGFTPVETASYVLTESVFTHIIGISAGIIGGTLLSGSILRLIEGRQFHIIRAPQTDAWMISALILLLFSGIIHAIIVRTVIKLRPTEDVMVR